MSSASVVRRPIGRDTANQRGFSVTKMSGSRFLAEAFKALGVTHFFYVPVIVPQAVKEMTQLGIVPVMTHGEKASAYMADGYARVARRPGVCGAQNIGGTNLAAGLRDACQARIPIVALTGGKWPSFRYRHAYQDIDDMPIYEAVTKFNAVVESADRLPDLLNSAFRAATTGMPQPVHLELGGLDGRAIVGFVDGDAVVDARFGSYPALRPPAPPEDVALAAAALAKAERPVLVAGGGVTASSAQSELCALAHKQNIPVATSLNAKGAIIDDDPLAIGVVGEYSRTCANRLVSEADLVVYIGSLTGGLVTRNWSVPSPRTRVIHIDINPENFGRNFPNTIPLCGDAKVVLQQLIDALQPAAGSRAWLGRVAMLKQEWRDLVAAKEASGALPLRPERLCRDISDALPDNAVVVGDTGHAGAWLAQNIYVKSMCQTFIRAHGSLGWAFPAAIGAKCAVPDRPVVCFTGDGGFYYHMAELETAVRYGINVVVIVNNNASLNQEQDLWRDDTAWDKNWRFAPVDIAAAARAFGCFSARVENPADTPRAMREALSAGRPAVIEAITDIRACSQPAWGPPGSTGMYAPPPEAA